MKRIILCFVFIIILSFGLSCFVVAKENKTNKIEFLEIEKINLTDYSYQNTVFFKEKINDNLPTEMINKAESIPVINYHFFYNEEIKEYCNEDICFHIDDFKKQLKYLKDNGYYTVTIEQFSKWMNNEIELPEKSILITIDDGACGTSFINGNLLIPALEEYKVNATLFLITAWWDPSNYESDYLSVESHGNDIHMTGTCGTSKIDCLTHEELSEDINKSVEILNSSIAFAFPFYHHTEDSLNVLEENNFKIAFVGGNRNATRTDYKYLIPRYALTGNITMEEFINIIK